MPYMETSLLSSAHPLPLAAATAPESTKQPTDVAVLTAQRGSIPAFRPQLQFKIDMSRTIVSVSLGAWRLVASYLHLHV